MGNELFSYLERLEIMVFFTGYAIIYALIFFLAGEFHKRQWALISLLPGLLPSAYALIGTLFFGYILKKVYVGYTMGISLSQIYHPYLVLWGILAMVFWIPAARKKPLLSLLHSLVFFFYIPWDMYRFLDHSVEKDVIKNDMNILSSSLLLNASTLLILLLLHYVLLYLRKRKISATNDNNS